MLTSVIPTVFKLNELPVSLVHIYLSFSNAMPIYMIGFLRGYGMIANAGNIKFPERSFFVVRTPGNLYNSVYMDIINYLSLIFLHEDRFPGGIGARLFIYKLPYILISIFLFTICNTLARTFVRSNIIWIPLYDKGSYLSLNWRFKQKIPLRVTFPILCETFSLLIILFITIILKTMADTVQLLLQTTRLRWRNCSMNETIDSSIDKLAN